MIKLVRRLDVVNVNQTAMQAAHVVVRIDVGVVVNVFSAVADEA
jgi:hypothetical protein